METSLWAGPSGASEGNPQGRIVRDEGRVPLSWGLSLRGMTVSGGSLPGRICD